MKIPEVAAIDARIDDSPAVEWIAAHRRELVDAALADLRNSTVGDDADRASQFRWILDYNVGLFVRVISGDAQMDEHSAAELVASAAIRAGEGFPIENLLETYVGGTAAIWRRMASYARPDELADLVALTSGLFDYLRGVMALVVRGFEREASRVRLGERDARYAVYSTLLAGGDVEQVSARSGIAVASRYLVFAIHVDDGFSSTGQQRSYVASSQRGHALLRALEDLASGEVLAVIGDPRGTALIPVGAVAASDDHEKVRAVISALADDLKAPVHVGACFAPASDVAAAARIAEDIMELVLAIDLPSGAWFLDDVLLPYQLTRPGPAFDLLRDRLDVLDAHPEWAGTLRVYARNGWDRARAAQELHVHPNTVDYRLRRMAEATGLDAGDPAQRAVILAAMYVRAAEHA